MRSMTFMIVNEVCDRRRGFGVNNGSFVFRWRRDVFENRSVKLHLVYLSILGPVFSQ